MAFVKRTRLSDLQCTGRTCTFPSTFILNKQTITILGKPGEVATPRCVVVAGGLGGVPMCLCRRVLGSCAPPPSVFLHGTKSEPHAVLVRAAASPTILKVNSWSHSCFNAFPTGASKPRPRARLDFFSLHTAEAEPCQLMSRATC